MFGGRTQRVSRLRDWQSYVGPGSARAAVLNTEAARFSVVELKPFFYIDKSNAVEAAFFPDIIKSFRGYSRAVVFNCNVQPCLAAVFYSKGVYIYQALV